jgi:hypothetical protein
MNNFDRLFSNNFRFRFFFTVTANVHTQEPEATAKIYFETSTPSISSMDNGTSSPSYTRNFYRAHLEIGSCYRIRLDTVDRQSRYTGPFDLTSEIGRHNTSKARQIPSVTQHERLASLRDISSGDAYWFGYGGSEPYGHQGTIDLFGPTMFSSTENRGMVSTSP